MFCKDSAAGALTEMLRRFTDASVTPLRHSFPESLFHELIHAFISGFFPGRVVTCAESLVSLPVQ